MNIDPETMIYAKQNFQKYFANDSCLIRPKLIRKIL